jgi:NhaA family Na+:H+ antiporter
MNTENILNSGKVVSNPKLDWFLRPFRMFKNFEASGGILLIFSTIVALVWSNSLYADSYSNLWQTPISFSFGSYSIKKSLLIWINDGLMAMFFFVVGLEIKREFIVGDLSSPKKAALPIAAAVGGMIVPALIYIFFSRGTSAVGGWGVPMATDIAFALGVLTLLGKRVPVGLKIFLAALAIVDDLGAVLVIAFFYTSELSMPSLLTGAFFFFSLLLSNYLGVRNILVYSVLGIGGLWLAFLLSGAHPTIAGVLGALCIPSRTRVNATKYAHDSREAIRRFEEYKDSVLTNKNMQVALTQLEVLTEQASTPLQRLERSLHPWAIYAVMPIFALANAGVRIPTDFSSIFNYPSVNGILLGLILGKQIGVFCFSWLAVKFKIASLPENTTWLGLYGVSCLAGIGFTMSLFIASLAYSDLELLAASKVAILLASSVMALWGLIVLLFSSNTNKL